jgi:prepilin peptidase CpaA
MQQTRTPAEAVSQPIDSLHGNPMTRFDSLQSISLAVAVLLALLAAAVWTDLRERRIPNTLVVLGLVTSLLLQSLQGVSGLQSWGLGLLVGFGFFVPLYAIRAMGAGDVKLMAMTGSFLGPAATVDAVLLTLVAGGVLAMVVALTKGALMHTLRNVQFLVMETVSRGAGGERTEVPPMAVSAGSLPYAAAVAVGTTAHLLLSRSGYTLFA